LTDAANTSQPRKSALLVGAVLALLAGWNVFRHRPAVAATLGAAGLALMVIAAVAPSAARAFHYWWMRLAAALGYVNSRILLGLTYFLVFTPFGFATRIARRDPLGRRSRDRTTYWIPRSATRQTRDGFEKAF
jgi:hypothetical protein